MEKRKPRHARTPRAGKDYNGLVFLPPPCSFGNTVAFQQMRPILLLYQPFQLVRLRLASSGVCLWIAVRSRKRS
jgi:hypothetical protein